MIKSFGTRPLGKFLFPQFLRERAENGLIMMFLMFLKNLVITLWFESTRITTLAVFQFSTQVVIFKL